MKTPFIAMLAALGLRAHAETVQVVGSDSMILVGFAWAEAFGKPVEVSGGGTGIGVAALLAGTADIAAVVRPLEEGENVQLTKRFGAAPLVTKVAHQGLAVFVHKDNPVAKITVSELREVFFAGGKIADWNQLGAKASSQIVPVIRHFNSGSFVFFREAIGGKRAEFKADLQRSSGDGEIVRLIEATPAAIGFATPSARSDGAKPLPLSPAPGKPPVLPTAEAIRDGTYPLSRPLYFVTAPKPSAATKKFIEFVLSEEGRAVCEKEGLTPIK